MMKEKFRGLSHLAIVGRDVTGRVHPLGDVHTKHDVHVHLVHRSTPLGDHPQVSGSH